MSTVLNRKDRRKLQALSVADWEILSELYLRDPTRNIFTYAVLKNYIEWVKKNPRILDDVRILTIDENWRTHGTFILEDRDELRYNITIGSLPQSNCQELFLKALNCLEPAYSLVGYREYFIPAIEKHLHQLGIKNYENGLCSTLLYYLPKEKAIQLQLNSMPNFIFKPLQEEHAQYIDDTWQHQYPGSYVIAKRIILYNITIGAFHPETNELCAWVVETEFGTIGILNVEDAYKRRGLGEHLVRLLTIELAKNNRDAIANVMDDNKASRRIFDKLDFSVIDRIAWRDKIALPGETKAIIMPNATTLKHG